MGLEGNYGGLGTHFALFFDVFLMIFLHFRRFLSPLASLGVLFAPLGVSWRLLGAQRFDFDDFWCPNGSQKGAKIDYFLVFFCYFFRHLSERLLGSILVPEGSILGAFWVHFSLNLLKT